MVFVCMEFFITATGKGNRHRPSGIWMAVMASGLLVGLLPTDKVPSGLWDPTSNPWSFFPGFFLSVYPTLEPFAIPLESHMAFL